MGENIPPEDTGVDAFIGVAGEAETGVGVAWFRGASDAGLEAGEKENMVEPWLPLLATGVEDSTAVNLKKKKNHESSTFHPIELGMSVFAFGERTFICSGTQPRLISQ